MAASAEHSTTSPISRPTTAAADLAHPGVTVGGASASSAAQALSARVAELLALLDQTGVVRVDNVEPRPDGRTSYDLRLVPEARPLPSSGALRIGEAVQRVAQLADLVAQGRTAGLELREVTIDGAAVAGARAEVVGLGTLLRTMLPKGAAQLPPVLETIIRRAIDEAAPDRYRSVNELRGDLLKLQQALPVPTRGGTVELTRSAQLLAAMELPELVTVASAAPLPDGRIGYALRQLLDGAPGGRPGLATSADLAAVAARLGEALVQGREAGLVLRELTSRGATLTFAGQEGRAELVALATVLRDLAIGANVAPSPALMAAISSALDADAPERLDEVETLRDELARQAQAARLLPMPPRPPEAVKPPGWSLWWFVAVAVVLVFGVLLLS